VYYLHYHTFYSIGCCVHGEGFQLGQREEEFGWLNRSDQPLFSMAEDGYGGMKWKDF